ncbi:hypothetical protein [Candidatus Thioglobus sp.]|uniref:hypothetical protein n=1 Tax=Candidatus Thioglobus sp. TaxID=2026721 RepID=UPI003D10DAF3
MANYQSVRFLVSTKKRQQAYNQLLVAAISAHQQRGKNIALNFGSKTYQFKQTNLNKPILINSAYSRVATRTT